MEHIRLPAEGRCFAQVSGSTAGLRPKEVGSYVSIAWHGDFAGDPMIATNPYMARVSAVGSILKALPVSA